jgi:hypothetical protein
MEVEAAAGLRRSTFFGNFEGRLFTERCLSHACTPGVFLGIHVKTNDFCKARQNSYVF